MASLNTGLWIARQREAVNPYNTMPVSSVILPAASSLPLVVPQFQERYYLHFCHQYVHINTYLYANLNHIC